MQPTIPVIALIDFEHHGELIQKGRQFDVSPIEAAALRYQKKADFTAMSRKDITVEEPSTPQPPKTKRTYRRRDLKAEP